MVMNTAQAACAPVGHVAKNDNGPLVSPMTLFS